MTVVGGATTTENIFEDELSCELVYRKLVNGVEADVERVIALRTHPLQLEFHQRNVSDGFRVAWNMPRGAPLEAVDAFVSEAKCMGEAAPTIIGYGEVSYYSLSTTIQTS